MSKSSFAATPEPPHHAAIFTSTRTAVDDGYGEVADRMVDLASKQPGIAQAAGHRRWDEHFEACVARVERAYGGPRAS
jgi:hypothetical protein